MAETCKFPLCKRTAEKNGYCVGHRIYSDTVTVSPPKELPKRSDKQKAIITELKKLYKIFLAKPGNKVCKIKSPVCTKTAVTVNHIRRRGKNVFNQDKWEPRVLPVISTSNSIRILDMRMDIWKKYIRKQNNYGRI